MTIFVQNYKKSVESSSVSVIVPIVLGIIIFLFEKASEKKKTVQKPADRPRRPAQRHAAPAAVTMPPRHPAQAPHEPVLRKTSSFRMPGPAPVPREEIRQPESPVLPEEGARVTADISVEPAPARRAAIPPVPGGDLRKAIIWSEILKRKF